MNLTSQQRTTIQQTVLAGSNVPRVNNVNFALGVGTVVPTSVRIVDVPPALIEINPAWRGHQYFVVRDEIVVVDRSRKIVAVVPVRSGGAHLRGGGGGGAAALNPSSDQIRQVQTVLKERGFDVVVDGRMGPRTVEAITAFQRQQGFQVSGRIDNQTISALGLSNMTDAQGGAQGSATTGQGGAGGTTQGGAAQQQAPAQQNQGANQPSTSGQSGASQQAPAQQNQGAGQQQPSTTGQSGSSQTPQQGQGQQPSAQQTQGANQPSTSGQAGSTQQQAPAQGQQSGESK
jgi:peptidoglycan hydrolase-like protein with peptidoglycan-binding domain